MPHSRTPPRARRAPWPAPAAPWGGSAPAPEASRTAPARRETRRPWRRPWWALAGEVFGVHRVDELLELLDDLVGVLGRLVLGGVRGLVEDALAAEDRRAGASGEGDGVGRTARHDVLA